MFVPMIIFIVMIVLSVGMLVFVSSVKPKYSYSADKKAIKKPEEIPMEKHVADLINVDEVLKNGIYRIGGMFFGMGLLSGTNFSVISEDNQNSKEDRLVEVSSDAVKYPTQTIATTIVANTDKSAEGILKRAKNDTINPAQKIYMKMYAQFLKELKAQRLVLSNQNWYVIGSRHDDDDPEDAILKRFAYLSDQFRRIGIVLTRVTTDVEVYDIIHQILLPDRIIAPSERYAAGVTEPLHWGDSEIKSTPA